MDFEVIKVVIKGKIPTSCEECFYCYSLIAQCEVMNRHVYNFDYKNTRPNWCPLVSKDCVESFVTQIDNVIFSTEDNLESESE